MNHSIADIRRDYKLKSLNEADTDINPYVQFGKWWDEAVNSQIDEVNAITLATASKEGIPAARIVLLKGYDEQGFVFFTNYNSAKGKEIEENPNVALLFFWKELERQIRINGAIEKIDSKQSDDYFQSRPVGSRIGAWASPQSTIIENRGIIENNVLKYQEQFSSMEIPRPQHWGGYVVKPTKIEFWQGRSNRLHDRIEYAWQSETLDWKRARLAP